MLWFEGCVCVVVLRFGECAGVVVLRFGEWAGVVVGLSRCLFRSDISSSSGLLGCSPPVRSFDFPLPDGDPGRCPKWTRDRRRGCYGTL